MIAVLGYPDFGTLGSPASAGTRITLHPALIEVPQFDVFIGQITAEPLLEGVSLDFVLSVRLRLRHLQTKVVLVQPANDGAIADFHRQGFTQITMEFLARPVRHTNL